MAIIFIIIFIHSKLNSQYIQFCSVWCKNVGKMTTLLYTVINRQTVQTKETKTEQCIHASVAGLCMCMCVCLFMHWCVSLKLSNECIRLSACTGRGWSRAGGIHFEGHSSVLTEVPPLSTRVFFGQCVFLSCVQEAAHEKIQQAHLPLWSSLVHCSRVN